ncbi:uncharacterized protein [Euwallacea similis]|uniref:uncharacterized protein n=1 Tax=Euwallacea similis TaxID=1736056 RepID=UPI00344D9302
MAKTVLAIIIIKILVFFPLRAHCDRKIWVRTSDIFSPTNWVNGALQRQCNGLVFGKQQEVDVFLPTYRVKSLTLPSYGVITIVEWVIFDENSTSVENCITLKSILPKPWFDVDSWQNLDDPDNPAVPLVDRIPSQYDDIVFEDYKSLNMLYLTHHVNVRTITYIGLNVHELIMPNDYHFRIMSSNESCVDITGCRSLQSNSYYYDICQIKKYRSQLVGCEDPIKPLGFCNQPRCGAEIVIGTLRRGFRLDRIKLSLQDLASRTHATKIAGNKVQIVFAEENFSGQSLIDATKFYNTLLGDESFSAGDVILRLSRPPLGSQLRQVKSAMSMVFGTLVAVAIVFGLLLVSYHSLEGNFTFRNRFLGNRPLSTYILGYNNIEDRGYIVDTRSVADLTSAFENPMYHQHASSRSTSNETLTSLKAEEKPDEPKDMKEMPVLEAEDEVEEMVLQEL